MSLSTLSFLKSAQEANNNTQVIGALSADFKAVIDELRNVARGFPKPFVFLKTDNIGVSSAVNADVLLVLGNPIPKGYKGQIEDFNINFSTAAGTVQIVIMQNKQIINRVLRNISSDTSGIGKVVLDEGQQLAIVGQTSGAGQFTTYCSGVIIKEQGF